MISEIILLGLTYYNLNERSNNNKDAKRIRENAFYEIASVDYEISNYSKVVDATLERLSNRRQAVFEQSFHLFIETMKPLELLEVTPQNSLKILNDMEYKIAEYKKIMNQYTIGKTEITRLEAVSSYFLFGIAGYYRKKSELTLEQSKIMRKSAEAVSAHSKNVIDFLKYIDQECKRMEDLTIKFNVLLIKSIRRVQAIVERNGSNKFLYTVDDRETIRLCFNITDALKKLNNYNPFENDAISNAFIRTIETGNQQLKELERLIDAQINNAKG